MTFPVLAGVLGVALGFCALAVAVFGLGPALTASRTDVVSALKDKLWGVTAKAGRGRRLMRNGLVVSQIALSFTLLTAGGLFLCGAWRARSADPGFSLENGLVAIVDGSPVQYAAAETRESLARVLDQARSGHAAGLLSAGSPGDSRGADSRAERRIADVCCAFGSQLTLRLTPRPAAQMAGRVVLLHPRSPFDPSYIRSDGRGRPTSGLERASY